MTRHLLFVHGRAQERKDAMALKAEWLSALARGLHKSGLALPISGDAVRFPFYGDTLVDMVGGVSADAAASVIVRGDETDVAEQIFARAIVEEICAEVGMGADQLAALTDAPVQERGMLHWASVQALLGVIDRHVPFASSASIALFTHDVYQYLNHSGIRETIHDGIREAVTPGVETVVVAHSLGTVVAYNLLRQEGHLLGWNIPLFVTLGSPLAVKAIRRAIRNAAPVRCPTCVSRWFNALDERDIVALYPLDPARFPLDPIEPAIENKRDVRNETPNRHGISGYLDDEHIARQIYLALAS